MEYPKVCVNCGRAMFRPPERSVAQFNKQQACSAACRVRSSDDRFWAKVDRSGGLDACWPWMAYRDKAGYGRFMPAPGKAMLAHRYAWGIANGSTELTIDHLCHCRACVNPRHLDAVTQIENNLRRDRHRLSLTRPVSTR